MNENDVPECLRASLSASLAFDAGRAWGRAGLASDGNPHATYGAPEPSAEYQAWEEGWGEGAEEFDAASAGAPSNRPGSGAVHVTVRPQPNGCALRCSVQGVPMGHEPAALAHAAAVLLEVFPIIASGGFSAAADAAVAADARRFVPGSIPPTRTFHAEVLPPTATATFTVTAGTAAALARHSAEAREGRLFTVRDGVLVPLSLYAEPVTLLPLPDVEVETFAPVEAPPTPSGGTTTPSACCERGCTDPPC